MSLGWSMRRGVGARRKKRGSRVSRASEGSGGAGGSRGSPVRKGPRTRGGRGVRVFYPRVLPLVSVSLGCWVLAGIAARTTVKVVYAGEGGFALLFGCVGLYVLGLGLYFPSLRLGIDPDGLVRYDTFFFSITFFPAEVRENRSDGAWVLRFEEDWNKTYGVWTSVMCPKWGHMGEIAWLLRTIRNERVITLTPFYWGIDKRPELGSALSAVRKVARNGNPRSLAARLHVLSQTVTEPPLTGWVRSAGRSVDAWWESRTWEDRFFGIAEKVVLGVVWVLGKVFQGLVWFLTLAFDWKEAERGYDFADGGMKPKPIVFRPMMEAVVAFWLCFGLFSSLCVWGAILAWGEPEAWIYAYFAVAFSLIPVWMSSLGLRIRTDGRFVYETFLYVIVFLPTEVRQQRGDREWVLAFDPEAVGPHGRPSVEFRAKRWWVGRVVLWGRQEFLGNEIEFSSGIWKIDKESYMLEVFTALRKAVKEGKQAALW